MTTVRCLACGELTTITTCPCCHAELLPGPLAHERSGRDRARGSEVHDEGGASRLFTPEDRDRAAELRDRGAERRDELARQQELHDDGEGGREDILLLAERARVRAASDRERAADDRARAASDREAAAQERAEAQRIRTEFANNLRMATIDELTSAQTRRFGLEEAARELERAHRTGAGLVLAFVDVDGLKRVNDNEGHLAGDALLALVGQTLRGNLRPYDVIVRYGGDEFVCAMPSLSASEARERFEKIAAAVAALDSEHSITVGLADAERSDDLQGLIARADADLLRARQSRQNADRAQHG